jgi:hypothetical protein
MDPIKTIGTFLQGGEERDAIHIAIFPAIVDEDCLRAGQPVRLVYGKTNHVAAEDYFCDKAIGIIDPFLPQAARLGDRVWAFLKPNSVTGMRHHWALPAIDNPPAPATEAEKWLRQFAEKWNFDWQDMMRAATKPLGEQDYITAFGKDLHGQNDLDAGDELMFWEMMEDLTGKRFSAAHRKEIEWSCSC